MMNPLSQLTPTSSTPQNGESIASTSDAKTGVFANLMETIQKHLAPSAESQSVVNQKSAVESTKKSLSSPLATEGALVTDPVANNTGGQTLAAVVSDGMGVPQAEQVAPVLQTSGLAQVAVVI
ncbi:MAG: hypothetical protein Q9M10_01180 [Mariprofundaceae bacterium]|nr:hypothetical protein [Mariprofundaceae bacterium]